MRNVALGIAVAGLSLSAVACSGTEPPPRAPSPSVLASTAADTREEAEAPVADQPTFASAYPRAPVRLSQTKTLGQGEELQYFPTYPYAVAPFRSEPSVVVVNNTVVNNYGAGYGY